MVRFFVSKYLIALMFIGLSLQVSAYASADKFLVAVSEDVLAAVIKERPTYKDNPQVLQEQLLDILDPVIDFDSFSRGVMGSYYGQATEDQRNRFKTAFKATLVDLYTGTLVAFEVTDMKVQETIMNSDTAARVIVNVTTRKDGSYLVEYNMRKNGTDQWMVRNIILDGLNIGYIYRNQFKSAMETEKQDLERVITLWPEIISGQ